MPERKRIKIKGIVQGVGFRPFVFRLAKELALSGFVRNTTAGVDIEIQGPRKRINLFLRRLEREKPRPAIIESIKVVESTLRSGGDFVIKESKKTAGFTQISPDIATCEDCLREMSSPRDRRYGFPFINCTNCGPRYSIIYTTPYDRKRTTMRKFKMCPDCTAEFNDVYDRRFHAQPDCCPICGPRYSLYSIKGKLIDDNADTLIKKTARLLREGRIIAIKGLGGFHIACDATNQRAVRRLRRLKHRPTKPFALMVRKSCLSGIVELGVAERELINSPVAPIMLLKKRGKYICEEVAPNNPYLGVMVPYTPLHHLLLDEIPYLVMTSANIQDEPIAKNREEVVEKLKDIVSFYLDHNRDIENRCDDSIGFYLKKRGFSIIRRSRGYAPVPVELPFSVEPMLAVGPYLKNTFTLADKREAYISPHIGDLDNLETLKFFNEVVAKYKKWFKITPRIIVHDLHPDYLSTRIAGKMAGRKVAVQHHIAHIVSCLGENMVFDKAIGIAFDGTGFGLDHKIWGGEFFIGDLKNQQRVAHLEYLPLPGGEISIKKPYRIAVAYLYKLFGKITDDLKGAEADTVIRMIEQKRNCVDTSSMGRLFDCVSALLGITREITYEAEAAINLEYAASSAVSKGYSYQITDDGVFVIRVADILAGIVRDLKKKIGVDVIAAKFHNTIVHFSLDVVKKLSRIYRVKKVCLSGGVFQNRYLLTLMIDELERNGFKVYVHHKLPTNDGCISYGQVIMAGSLLKKRSV